MNIFNLDFLNKYEELKLYIKFIIFTIICNIVWIIITTTSGDYCNDLELAFIFSPICLLGWGLSVSVILLPLIIFVFSIIIIVKIIKKRYLGLTKFLIILPIVTIIQYLSTFTKYPDSYLFFKCNLPYEYLLSIWSLLELIILVIIIHRLRTNQ